MRGRWAVVVAIVAAWGCTSPVVNTPDAGGAPDAGTMPDAGSDAFTPSDGGADAFVETDASMDIDAFAPDASTPDDAGTDAFVPPDMGTDAGGCPSGQTMCPSGCVDLATDSNNCGACGYAVVGARTCVAGVPTPGWLAVPTAGAPLRANAHLVWTGSELLDVSDAGAPADIRAFDPAAGTWRSVTPPLGGLASSAPIFLVGMPDRHAALLVQSSGAFLWDHTGAGGAGVWTPVAAPPSLWSGVTFEPPASVYTGTYVFVFNEGGTPGSGLRYTIASNTWTAVAGFPGCSHNSISTANNGTSFTYANGLVVAMSSSDPRTTSPAQPCMESQQHAYLLDPDGLTWTAASPTRDAVQQLWFGMTLLPVGSAVYLAGGEAMALCGTAGLQQRTAPVIWDPRGGTTTVGYPGMPASAAFAAFTGRAIISFGGLSFNSSPCGAAPVSAPSNDLAVGVFDGTMLRWRAGPAAGISYRGLPNYVASSAQPRWTGRELFVYDGMVDGGCGTGCTASVHGGSRYQPPVGCVCPRDPASPPSVADGCAGVSTPPAAYAACIP